MLDVCRKLAYSYPVLVRANVTVKEDKKTMMEHKVKINLENKRIFITGVAGFIGSNLAKRLPVCYSPSMLAFLRNKKEMLQRPARPTAV